MKYIRLLLCFGLLFLQAGAQSQVLSKNNYPQGYFRDPLNIPIKLAGNFGELRSNHYHMGMDIKTDAKENQPVYAAADGYVSRIKIEPGGFGRAIYINHPNGFTTVYGHLNDFNFKLESYLKQQQYAQESWKVFLEIPPGTFPVKKGDFIAYSGNTGGSQGPHLHFEIRRTADDVNLNPQLFGFPLADDTNPVLLKLAVYDRNKSTYEQAPQTIPVKGSAKGYVTIPAVISTSSSKVSFAIGAYDTHTGSSNKNGIYEALLYVDGEAVSAFRMDGISYNETRYLNAHIDYRTRENGGPYLQHLSALPGYVNSIYEKIKGDGVIDISDEKVHDIKIEVKDAAGNTSVLNYRIQFNGNRIAAASPPGKIFYPLMLDVSENKDCEFYIGENCLYDSAHIRYATSLSSNPIVVSAIHTIGNTLIPLQDSMTVRIKLDTSLSADKKEKVIMQRFAGSDKEVEKVKWQGDWASARFREFGNFQLVVDEIPPQVLPVNFSDGSNLSKAGSIIFNVKDNFVEIKSVKAMLDGKWLRFTNDKRLAFIYKFDEMCSDGGHTLTIIAEDEAGNKTTASYHFTR